MDQVRDLGLGPVDGEDDAAEGGEEDDGEDAAVAKDSEKPVKSSRSRTWSGNLGGKLPAINGNENLPARSRSASEQAFSAGDLAGAAKPRPFRPPRGLEVRERPDGSVHVQGLTKLNAADVNDIRRIIDRGQARRATAQTALNVQSSRSHTVFSVYLPGTLKQDGTSSSGVYLSFVDLAGSERLAKSKAEGVRFQEAMSINSSLTALGKVVLALASDPKTVKHVPYRDSKLTRILSPSLGGGTQVALLATVNPRVEDYEESLNTLSFADRCKNVARQPQVSYISARNNQKQRISDLQAEVANLKDALKKAQDFKGGSGQGPGAARAMDSIDVAIAEALAKKGGDRASGDRANPGGLSKVPSTVAIAAGKAAPSEIGGNGGDQTLKKSPKSQKQSAKDAAEIEELMHIQEDRNRQAKSKEKYDAKIQALEKESEQVAKMDNGRVAQVASLEDRKAALMEELQKAEEMLKQLVKDRERELGDELHIYREKEHASADDGGLLAIHQGLRKGLQIGEQKISAAEEKRREQEENHLEHVRLMKEKLENQLEELKKKMHKELYKRSDENAHLEKELAQLEAQDRLETKAIEDEISSIYDMVFELARLCMDVENGEFPTIRQGDGLRSAMIPEGHVPPEPDAQSHPKLLETLAKAERKVLALQMTIQKPFPVAGRLRRLVAAATGVFDGIDTGEESSCSSATATATVSCQPSGRVVTGNLDPEDRLGYLRPVAKTASPREGRIGSDLSVLGETWSPDHFVERFLRIDDIQQAERFLSQLTPARLREINLRMRTKAIEVFPISKERVALIREVKHGLEDEATGRYIRELEKKRSVCRANYADAIERVRRLRIDLEIRRCSLSTRSSTPFSSRPGSANASRQRTPSKGNAAADARQSSRPSTAQRIAAEVKSKFQSSNAGRSGAMGTAATTTRLQRHQEG
eukprot:TRINITY_DN22027_c1_g2_i1.p1 TRINITY_DN22027_c1_g2~~TRINITY_DN22027_c1_g2_i1.p1  ORF type:complete len:931 (-),score=209.68 TRINITY_DN22027_c1_g2_i1:157-2949(-)